ncbi:MAG: YciC family protein [Pseudomonadales bacterium]|jgi:hypothetical protein
MSTFEYLRQSFFFFKQNFSVIAKIQLPFLVVLNGLALWLDINVTDTNEFREKTAYISILSLTLLPIYWGATILLMQSKLENSPISASQAIIASLSFWRSLLFTFILTSFAVFGGLLLFILPGIYIGVRLAFADYICVLEKQSALNSLKQSWKDTSDYFWTLLPGLAILFIGIQLIEMPIAHTLSNMEERSILIELPIVAVVDLLGALITVFGFRIYCVMREETRSKETGSSKPADTLPDDTDQ